MSIDKLWGNQDEIITTKQVWETINSFSNAAMTTVDIVEEILSEKEALNIISNLEQELEQAINLYDPDSWIFGNIEGTKALFEFWWIDEKYLTKDLIEIYALFWWRTIPEENIKEYKRILDFLKSEIKNPELQAQILKIIDLFDTYIISMKGWKVKNKRKLENLENNYLLNILFININNLILKKYIPWFVFNKDTWVDDFNKLEKDSILIESTQYMSKFIDIFLKNIKEFAKIIELLCLEKFNEKEIDSDEIKIIKQLIKNFRMTL